MLMQYLELCQLTWVRKPVYIKEQEQKERKMVGAKGANSDIFCHFEQFSCIEKWCVCVCVCVCVCSFSIR